MSKTYNVAVLGATGAVGETMMALLEERDFPVGEVFPLASQRSAGKTIEFKGRELTVLDVESFDFSQAQIGLFSAGASVSEVYGPKAAAAGCVVVDNTSRFRYEDDIPLVVPEVNAHAIAQYTNRGIIANPNCSTIQMLVALKPIQDAVGIERINVCTYQAVSGTGKQAIEELGHRGTGLADRGAAERQAGHAEGLSQADRLQCAAADRCLHGQRLHQGRNEDGLGNPQDHG